MAQQNTTSGRICAEEYTVKRGDSFYLIAHKLGVPLRDLLAANSSIHPARLMVGDVLCIPREEDDSSGGLDSSGSGSTANGTAGSAANNSASGADASSGVGSTGSGTGVSTGSAANSSQGSTAGNSAASSGSEGRNASPCVPDVTTDPNDNNYIPPCPLDDRLIVQRGQTVADIQLRNLVSRNTLEKANPNINLDALRMGQTICVPKENIACDIPTTYTLGTAENLEAVAVQFNLPIASILRANPCLAPQDFETGVTVVIPR